MKKKENKDYSLHSDYSLFLGKENKLKNKFTLIEDRM